ALGWRCVGKTRNMKRCFTVLLIVACFLCGFAAAQSPVSFVTSAPTDEVRALWVVRTTLTSPEKIKTMVSASADNGFNTLIVQVRGRGDAYYKSRVEPGAAGLKDRPKDLRPLAFTPPG